jgi:hypothetical protein
MPMLKALVPWALAGIAGWLVPRWFSLREDWQRILVAALAGALTGWLIWQL